MSTYASRTAAAGLAVGRLVGHGEGYRVLNGGIEGMKEEEQAFRYRMHELAGEVQQLRQMCGEDDRYMAGLGDLWKRVYDLHEFAAKSNRRDDLIMLLMMARKEWRGMPLEAEKLAVLQECLGRMAKELHTEKLAHELGDMLEAAGVD